MQALYVVAVVVKVSTFEIVYGRAGNNASRTPPIDDTQQPVEDFFQYFMNIPSPWHRQMPYIDMMQMPYFTFLISRPRHILTRVLHLVV